MLRSAVLSILNETTNPQLVIALARLVSREDVIERLVTMATDRYTRTKQRVAATTALAGLATSKSNDLIEHFVACLASAAPVELRVAAAYGLLSCGGPETAAVATAALSEAGDHEELTEVLLDVITANGSAQHQPAVIADLASPNPRIRWLAAQALSVIGDSDAIAPLHAAAKSGPRELQRYMRETIEVIQSRLGLAALPGGLSVASSEAGQLAFATAEVDDGT